MPALLDTYRPDWVALVVLYLGDRLTPSRQYRHWVAGTAGYPAGLHAQGAGVVDGHHGLCGGDAIPEDPQLLSLAAGDGHRLHQLLRSCRCFGRNICLAWRHSTTGCSGPH